MAGKKNKKHFLIDFMAGQQNTKTNVLGSSDENIDSNLHVAKVPVNIGRHFVHSKYNNQTMFEISKCASCFSRVRVE